jgi:hypothetical protein
VKNSAELLPLLAEFDFGPFEARRIFGLGFRLAIVCLQRIRDIEAQRLKPQPFLPK